MEGKELSKPVDHSENEDQSASVDNVDTSEMSEWEKRLEGMK